MPNTSTKLVSADQIAEMADRGQNISTHFTNQFTMVAVIGRARQCGLTEPMLKELAVKRKR